MAILTAESAFCTPEDALGCTADVIILANVSSSSWDLRVHKVPLLGEEERHRLGNS